MKKEVDLYNITDLASDAPSPQPSKKIETPQELFIGTQDGGQVEDPAMAKAAARLKSAVGAKVGTKGVSKATMSPLDLAKQINDMNALYDSAIAFASRLYGDPNQPFVLPEEMEKNLGRDFKPSDKAMKAYEELGAPQVAAPRLPSIKGTNAKLISAVAGQMVMAFLNKKGVATQATAQPNAAAIAAGDAGRMLASSVEDYRAKRDATDRLNVQLLREYSENKIKMLAEYEAKMDASQLAYLERKNKAVGEKINALYKAEEMKINEKLKVMELEIKQEESRVSTKNQNELIEQKRQMFLAQQNLEAQKFNTMANIRAAEINMKMLADRQKIVGKTGNEISETLLKANGMFTGMGDQWSHLSGIMAKMPYSPNQAAIGTTKQNIEARMQAAGLTQTEKYNFMTNIAQAMNTGGFVNLNKLTKDNIKAIANEGLTGKAGMFSGNAYEPAFTAAVGKGGRYGWTVRPNSAILGVTTYNTQLTPSQEAAYAHNAASLSSIIEDYANSKAGSEATKSLLQVGKDMEAQK